MLSRKTLSLLLEKARDAQQTAVRELGRLHLAERAELAKQDLLRDFRQETIKGVTAQQQQSITTAQLKAPSVLLDKVEQALAFQKTSVVRAQNTRHNAEIELSEHRKKLKRLEVLQARADKAQSAAAKRREQKLNDEFAARSKRV